MEKNCEEARKQRKESWVNPYKAIIQDFPGSLFPMSNPEVEISELKSVIEKASEVIVELGSGSGLHAIALATSRPSAEVFGFELRFKRSVRTIQKAREIEVSNLQIIRSRAEMIADVFSNSEIDSIYVNFPDPWPRAKERKHRLLKLEFLFVIAKLLSPNGAFYFKTDHAEYFSWVIANLERQHRDLEKPNSDKLKIVELSHDLANSEYDEVNILTEFESLFRGQGKPIHYLKAVKQKHKSKEVS